MNRLTMVVVAVVVSVLLSKSVIADEASPYAGQQLRDIKSLSKQQIEGYLAGKGMGYAKAAELNHFPGPRHVLDLQDKLNLTAEQRQSTQALFDSMQKEAAQLGKLIVAEEKHLDELFASGHINDDALNQSVLKIAELEGRLRFTHLVTHLKQKQILAPEQVNRYDQLRGYTGDMKHHAGSHDHHH